VQELENISAFPDPSIKESDEEVKGISETDGRVL
jgi:hypothetical protein